MSSPSSEGEPAQLMRRSDVILIGMAVAAIYVPFSFFRAPDVTIFLAPWLRHIEATGPIRAFAHPFGNYSPPYLYLLAVASLLHLSELLTIKLLSIVGASWIAFSMSRLALRLGAEPLPAAALTLVLPSLILNAPVLGQCDSFWAGCCVLAVAAAVDNRPYRMAMWAGVAVSFKAQAAFLAPFCIYFLVTKRAWRAALAPPIVCALSIAPAAMAGWPLDNLLTIYLRQAQLDFIGNAPNIWAIPAALGFNNSAIFLIGYILAAIAAIGLVCLRGRDQIRIALLSAILIPFLLPKMHERYFFLADVLSLALAYARRDRFSVATAALIQTGSVLSIIAYLGSMPWLNAIASISMGCAVCVLISLIISPNLERGEEECTPSELKHALDRSSAAVRT